MSSMDNLFKQFKESRGYNFVLEEENQNVIDEFVSWLQIQKEMGEDYSSLLNDLGILYDKQECAEIGKGKYDSIAKNLDTTIITTDEDINPKGIFIHSGFKVYSGLPTIISKITERKITMGRINTKIINTFMTHNPYNERLVDNWQELPKHNSNIVVGIFGDKNDKNIKDKINFLKRFKERLGNKFIDETATYNNTYCEVVATTQKVKRIGA